MQRTFTTSYFLEGEFACYCKMAAATLIVYAHWFLSSSRCGLAVRRLAGKQKDLGSIRFGSPFSSLQKMWFMDTVL